VRLVRFWSAVLVLTLGGCMIRWPTAERPARYLALGDSYTIGEAVLPIESFPAQLTTLLRGQGLYMDEPQIIARTGWTTDELSAGIDARDPAGPFELVTLLVGVNNQYRGRGAEEYRQQFAALLERAIAFAGGEPSGVMVLSIPDWGATPFAEKRDRARIAQEIDQFNAINREEAQRAGVRYVDVTPISRQVSSDPALVASDRLHPSAKMYAQWARLALPEALEVLK
jgi:lysophospholipase L1-like esterase